ncbi:MAG: T9SS type A sorting domain-containing protein [Ignavibacteria bacterium]
MKKLISIVLLGLSLSGNYFAQPKLFGYKISGNGDIISDVFLIQDGFILDSATSSSRTYRFEYNEDGKLKRDINFITFRVLDTTGSRPRTRMVPGYRHYFYNQEGDIDSVGMGIWNGTPPAVDSAGYRISYSYDNEGNLLSKSYSSNGDTFYVEENSYDSFGNMLLNKIIRFDYADTTYNIREYDSLSRLTLSKHSQSSNPQYSYQYVYNYDSSGNINCTQQTIILDSLYNSWNYYMEFDESGKAVYEILSRIFNPVDSTWLENSEIFFDYDEENRILKMGETARFHYNTDGNLDTLINTHIIASGYLGNRGTLVDSYGNQLWFPFPDPAGVVNCYYSTLITGTKKEEVKVQTFTLSQNYPNPFNPTTTITYTLPKSSIVTLKVYDILGKEIATLVNEEKLSGTYNVTWNAWEAASGVYFYKITAGEYSKVNKMMLLK